MCKIDLYHLINLVHLGSEVVYSSYNCQSVNHRLTFKCCLILFKLMSSV
jgi:hypothetical protein